MGQRTIDFTINKNKFRYCYKEYSGVHTLEVETKDKKVREYGAFSVEDLVSKVMKDFSKGTIERFEYIVRELSFGG